MSKPQRVSFPYLRAWNRKLSSSSMYNVDVAKAENAPEDVVYRTHEGGWVTLRDLKPEIQNDVITVAKSYGYVEA